MVTSYAIRSTVLDFSVTRDMIGGVCYSLHLAVYQNTAAPIRPPQIKVTNLRIAAQDEEGTAPTSEVHLSLGPIKTKLGTTARQQSP